MIDTTHKDNNQQTISNSISIKGIGLHTGNLVELTLEPAAVDNGVKFIRTDKKNDNVLVESEITIDEAAILKKMFLIYFYDRTIRTNIANASSDTIVQVTDQGSTVKKINKNEVIKSLTSLKRQEYTEMKELIRDYKSNQVRPRQVVGDDTIKGVHKGDSQFVRTEVYTSTPV